MAAMAVGMSCVSIGCPCMAVVSAYTVELLHTRGGGMGGTALKVASRDNTVLTAATERGGNGSGTRSRYVRPCPETYAHFP